MKTLNESMTLRVAKTALVFAVAFYYLLLVFDNLTDYNSNFQFIRHVLMMDSTFSENHAMWRALNPPLWHTIFYISIIAWESVTLLLCGWGAIRMARALRGSAATFSKAKNVAIAALTLSLLMWLLAFLSVGGEWFLMWQSKTWNGQEAALRMFVVIGIVLLLNAMPETELEE
jgi:predicted small integral membrane protein